MKNLKRSTVKDRKKSTTKNLNIWSEDELLNIWHLLISTYTLVKWARNKELKPHHASYLHAGILHVLTMEGGKSSLGTISRWVLQGHQSLSGVLTRMERNGFIKRGNNPKRKGSLIIEITDKGKELARVTAKRESIHSIFSSLSIKEKKQLVSSLYKIMNKAFDENYKYEYISKKEEIPYLIADE